MPKSANARAAVAEYPYVTAEEPAVVSEKIAAIGNESAPLKLTGKPGEAARPTQKYYDVDLDEYQV